MIVYVFGKDAKIALAIAKAESGLNCKASHLNSNGTIDSGIFQLNQQPILDCLQNIERAKVLFDKRGWHPWVTFNNNSYKKNLNE